MVEQAAQKRMQIKPAEITARVNFGTDATPGETYQDWPKEFFVLQSIDLLTYTDVFKAFTDEATFCKLQAVKEITGSRQRVVGLVSDPNFQVQEQMTAIQISLDGVIPPDQLLALYQKTQEAGHYMPAVQKQGMEGNVFTIFTIIPGYARLVG
jgi:hypothetical protein